MDRKFNHVAICTLTAAAALSAPHAHASGVSAGTLIDGDEGCVADGAGRMTDGGGVPPIVQGGSGVDVQADSIASTVNNPVKVVRVCRRGRRTHAPVAPAKKRFALAARGVDASRVMNCPFLPHRYLNQPRAACREVMTG